MFSSKKNIFNTLYESVVRFGPNSGQNGGSRSGSPPSTANSVADSERYIPNSGLNTGNHGIAPTRGRCGEDMCRHFPNAHTFSITK